MKSRPILLTGFEPYAGRGINPATEVVHSLDGKDIGGRPVVGRTIPVVYSGLKKRIRGLARELDPAVCLGLGLWPGEAVIRLERVALNMGDFEIPDNENEVLREELLNREGPAARVARLPLREILVKLLRAGIPARISGTAGTFLCNAAFYYLLEVLSERDPGALCGFVHLPYLPEQVAKLIETLGKEQRLELHQRADLASMDLDLMVRAVEVCLSACTVSQEASQES